MCTYKIDCRSYFRQWRNIGLVQSHSIIIIIINIIAAEIGGRTNEIVLNASNASLMHNEPVHCIFIRPLSIFIHTNGDTCNEVRVKAPLKCNIHFYISTSVPVARVSRIYK